MLSDSDIFGNQAKGDGGGIAVEMAEVDVSMSKIHSNAAGGGGGGGISVEKSQFVLSDSDIFGNEAKADGGGIAAENSLVVLVRAASAELECSRHQSMRRPPLPPPLYSAPTRPPCLQ